MSKSRGVRTIRLPLPKIWSAIPAVALISAGIILPASAAPTTDIRMSPVSSNSAAIVVPDTALTLSGSADPSPVRAPRAPVPNIPAPNPLAPMLPAGTLPGSSALVTLDSTGIPVRAIDGYRKAASLVGSADPACHIDWALLAAIGRVESDHARFGGNQLDSAGVARPGIIGIRLDGSRNGTALITDTDHGLLDGDTSYDRAVGPMQFLPSTWRVVGVDANGDGVKNPQDIADAATSAAIYLCSGHGDLSRPDELRAAILRYNASDSYAGMVTAIADAYRHGVSALPATDLAPAPSALTSRTSGLSTTPANPASAKPTSTGSTGPKPALTPVAHALPQPAKPQPAQAKPAQPTSAAASTTSTTSPGSPTITASPCLPTPAPTSTASPTTSTSTASPTTAQPCLPTPCLASPAPTVSCSSATPTA
jgi:hypothetical protein